ncbi:MAG: alpha/beta fold hydrolase [Saccharospirillum sp.]|nr:alpha/beta fold hydrolase [Saccharospirillum sp.]
MKFDGPEGGPLLILAHGAGAPMDSDFMNRMTALLNEQGIRIGRFEFPYMAERRTSGKKRPPDRAPRLLAHFREVLDQVESPVFIGGKSMGGRMATMLATEVPVKGVCVLGYPFHAPGKETPRIDHFADLQCPVLICQGERDPMGQRAEVEGYDLGQAVELHWLGDGNHDLAPRKASGLSAEQNWLSAAQAIGDFIRRAVSQHTTAK